MDKTAFKSGDVVYAVLSRIPHGSTEPVMRGVLNPRLRPGSEPVSFAPFKPGTDDPDPDAGYHVSEIEISPTYEEAARKYNTRAEKLIREIRDSMIPLEGD